MYIYSASMNLRSDNNNTNKNKNKRRIDYMLHLGPDRIDAAGGVDSCAELARRWDSVGSVVAKQNSEAGPKSIEPSKTFNTVDMDGLVL
ncbi:hypothetical protein LguiA_007917 [Lonicera macranthoides]